MADETARIDVWLWRARFFKTRTLASDHVSGRGVRISRDGLTRRINKAGTQISPGDVLTFTKAGRIQTVEIQALGTRRGPADEAAQLYQMIEDPE